MSTSLSHVWARPVRADDLVADVDVPDPGIVLTAGTAVLVRQQHAGRAFWVPATVKQTETRPVPDPTIRRGRLAGASERVGVHVTVTSRTIYGQEHRAPFYVPDDALAVEFPEDGEYPGDRTRALHHQYDPDLWLPAVADASGAVEVALLPEYGASVTLSVKVAGADPDALADYVTTAVRRALEANGEPFEVSADKARRVPDTRVNVYVRDYDIGGNAVERLVGVNVLTCDTWSFMRSQGSISTIDVPVGSDPAAEIVFGPGPRQG